MISSSMEKALQLISTVAHRMHRLRKGKPFVLCQAQEKALAGMGLSKSRELPDRGRANETKTVTDPHSEPVQE